MLAVLNASRDMFLVSRFLYLYERVSLSFAAVRPLHLTVCGLSEGQSAFRQLGKVRPVSSTFINVRHGQAAI